MRTFLLTFLLCLFLGQAQAGEPLTEASNSIELELSEDLKALFTFSSGFKPSATDPANRSILKNQDGSLVGCTLRPATQTGYIYLFVTRRDGDVIVMQNLNKRLEQLFPSPPAGFDRDCIVLEGINGRILSLTSSTHSKLPSVNFQVKVGGEGNLILVRP